MTWTTPATVTVGQIMTAGFWNQQVRDDLAWLHNNIESGTDTVALSAAVTATKAITFPIAFTVAPMVVVGSQFTTTGATDFVAGVDATVGNPTTTGFTVRVMSTTKISITATCRIYWVAIGL